MTRILPFASVRSFVCFGLDVSKGDELCDALGCYSTDDGSDMPTRSDIPVTGVVPIEGMRGWDEDETGKLRAMETRARQFLERFKWCLGIREFYFGTGIGKVVAVFLARIIPSEPSVDEYLWIVVGDLPSAHLVTDDARNPKEALEAYIWEMRRWVALAAEGKSSPDVIPVNVPATPEWAESLATRLDLLEQQIIPACFELSDDDPSDK